MQLLPDVSISPTVTTSLVLASVILWMVIAYRRSQKWTQDVPCGYNTFFPLGHIYFLLTNSTVKNLKVPGAATVLGLMGYQYAAGVASKFLLIKILWKNVVLLTSPEAAITLLKNKDEIAKASYYQPLKSVLGEGLITSKGDEVWKLHRKTINPMFHTKMLERFQSIMSKHAKTMVDLMEQQEGDIITAQPYFGPCTFDIVVEASTGKEMALQTSEDQQILKAIERYMELAAQRVYNPWLLPNFIFKRTSYGRESKTHSEYAVKYFRQLLNERREYFLKGKEQMDFVDERPCMVDVLLEQQLQGKDHFSDDEIIHELQNIAIPGFETSTASLSFSIFSIGHHPEIQKKIHKELDDIFGSDTEREITSQDWLKMKYLDCVIKESLRYWPPVPIIARTLKKDMQVENAIIPKGTDVVVFSPAVHRNPIHFPNPDMFDPDRFLVDDPERHETAYIPFSFGPRNCVGGSFALRAMRNILAQILRRFTIKSVDPFDTLYINFATIGKPHKPVLIQLTKREFQGECN